MSIANIFDAITKPLLNRPLAGLSGLGEQAKGAGFSDLLKGEGISSEWADIAGARFSGALNSAMLALQEHGDVSDVKELWEEMSEGQSLDDKLMANADYVAASITASMKFGATGDVFDSFGSSDDEYDAIFGTSSFGMSLGRWQSLFQDISADDNDLSSKGNVEEMMQLNMMYRFRKVI